MTTVLPESGTEDGLPLDDGRGPDEVWPWRRSEDFSPKVRWGRHALLLIVLLTAGLTGAVGGDFGVIGCVIAIASALLIVSAAVVHDAMNRWPAWRQRNLAAAEARANRALAATDSTFAKQMGWRPPALKTESTIPAAARRNSTQRLAPGSYPGTTGPIVRGDDASAEDLPF